MTPPASKWGPWAVILEIWGQETEAEHQVVYCHGEQAKSETHGGVLLTPLSNRAILFFLWVFMQTEAEAVLPMLSAFAHFHKAAPKMDAPKGLMNQQVGLCDSVQDF